MNYPTSLDNGTSLPNPSASSNTNNPSHAGLHGSENAAIIAVETKLGTGASTPASNTLLVGTGAGTSAWQGLTSAQLAAILSDETGTGSAVFANTPTLITPKVDTINENTPGNGVTVGGVNLKSGVVTGSGAGLSANTVPGTSIANNTITGQQINWAATGANGGVWWEELGRATASSTVAALTTGTLSVRKYLKIMFVYVPTSSITAGRIQFNGDSANNYNYRVSDNGGADSTGAVNGMVTDAGGNPTVTLGEFLVVNIAGQEKVWQGWIMDGSTATGVTNIGKRRETIGKWTGTSVVTTVTLNSSSTNMGAGSEVVVLGHN